MVTPPKPDLSPSGRPLFEQVGRNILSNWFALAFAAVIAFFLAPFIVNKLGDAAYGIWILIGSVTGYLGLLDFGVRGATMRYVSRAHAQADHTEASRIATSSLAIFTVTGAIAFLIALGVAAFALPYFNIPAERLREAQFVLTIAGMTVASSLVSGVFGGVVVGMLRHDLANLIEVLATIVRTVAVVAALNAGQGIMALALINLGASLLTCLSYAVLSFRLYPQLKVRRAYSDWAHVRTVYSFGFFLLLLHFSDYLIFHTDSIVIGAFLPVSQVTYYAIGGNLILYARSLLAGVSTTMTPAVSRLHAIDDMDAVRRALLFAARLAAFAMLPVTISFLLRGSTFISLWMGPAYGELSGAVLAVLALPYLFAPANQVAGSAALGMGLQKRIVPVRFAEALANLGLSVWLVQSLGIIGVAWGTVIPGLLVALVFWPWFLRRNLQVPILEYVTKAWARPILAAAPFAAASYAIERWWPAANLTVFFAQVALILPLVAPGYWYLCLTREERSKLVEKYLRRKRP